MIFSESRILVVADDRETRQLIVTQFAQQSAQVRAAANGDEALRLLTTHHFDCVIADEVNQSGMSGIALTRAIRQTEKLADMPVVLLAASVHTQALAKGAGATDSLHRVKEVSRFVEVVSRALREKNPAAKP